MYPSTQFVRSRMSPVGLLLLLFVPPRSALSSLGGIYINTCDSDCRPQKYTPYRHRHLWEGQSLSEKKENFPNRGLQKDFGIRSQCSSHPTEGNLGLETDHTHQFQIQGDYENGIKLTIHNVLVAILSDTGDGLNEHIKHFCIKANSRERSSCRG